jgi:hypothetical protein
LLLEALEDRLPPGQVGFGSLALALMGPSLSLAQLDALTSERGNFTAVSVDQQPMQSGLASTPATLDSPSSPTLSLLNINTDQASSRTSNSTLVANTDSVPSDLGTPSALDEAAQSALATQRATLGPVSSSGIDQVNHTAMASTDSVAARDTQLPASQPVIPADTSVNPNQGREALLVAALGASSGRLGGGNITPQDVSIGDNVLVNSRTNCGGGRGIIQSETTLTTTFTPSGNEAIVVGYNDFRGFYCSGSGYQVTGWGYSLDGGQTFTDGGPLPGRTSLGGDPWLATGPDGTVYYASLYQPLSTMAVLRGTATDTGINWSNPVLIRTSGEQYDKEAMAIDQNNGTIYISYTSFSSGGGIKLYKSTDGGLTFQGPFTVSHTSGAQGSVPAVGPNGEVYVAYGSYPGFAGVGFAVSYDQGQTWQDSGLIERTNSYSVPGADRSPLFPHIAVDTTGGPYNGNIYISYPSGGTGGRVHAFMTSSNDGGATWNAPIEINDDGDVGIQWQPTINVDANGNVNSFFYDRRDNPNTTLTNLYFAQSTDGGQSFNANILATSAVSNWHFVSDGSPAWGDYMNSISDGADSIVAYADGRDGDPDAYFIRAAAV